MSCSVTSRTLNSCKPYSILIHSSPGAAAAPFFVIIQKGRAKVKDCSGPFSRGAETAPRLDIRTLGLYNPNCADTRLFAGSPFARAAALPGAAPLSFSRAERTILVMKRVLSLTLALALCLTLFGCTAGTSESSSSLASESSVSAVESESSLSQPESSAVQESQSSAVDTADLGTATVAALKGPTAMGMVKMMSDDAASDSPLYDFNIYASADEITPKLVQGELDIAAVPANLASVLYNNTEGQVQVLAINTLGVLYIVEDGDTVQSVEDLKGKTIFASGKGSTPEYALNYMLTQNGIDPETDVTIEWKSEHSECVASLAATENAIAMLPQPFVTTAQTQNENLRVALDITEEWEKLASANGSDATLITGVVVGRKDFVEQNPQLVQEFLSQYEQSVAYTQEDTAGAAALVSQYDIVPEAVAQKALPECNITFIKGEEMQAKLSAYLQTLLDQNPKSIGGQLPGDDFYYLG